MVEFGIWNLESFNTWVDVFGALPSGRWVAASSTWSAIQKGGAGGEMKFWGSKHGRKMRDNQKMNINLKPCSKIICRKDRMRNVTALDPSGGSKYIGKYFARGETFIHWIRSKICACVSVCMQFTLCKHESFNNFFLICTRLKFIIYFWKNIAKHKILDWKTLLWCLWDCL